jgi:hypothetical protein
MNASNLGKIMTGMDHGVILPVAMSNGTSHDFTENQKQNLIAKEIRRKRYERQMERK